MTLPFDFFGYRKGNLTVEGIPLSKIAEEVGTPAYVYSTEGFLAPLRELQKGFKGLNHLICFAVKANSNVNVLRLLGGGGAGMDVVSGGELFRAESAGVDTRKIVFSGVGKTVEEMAFAFQCGGGKGIHSFNVESIEELKTLNQVALAKRRHAVVAARFNPDVNPKTHPYISTGLKKNKFGMTRAEILEIVRNLDELPGIDFQGISIHIGSQLLSLSPLDDAYRRLRDLVEEVEAILERPLSFLDLGGGVGITYKAERTPDIQKYCSLIRKHFGKKAVAGTPFQLIIEPGRSISGNAGVLLTRVLYRKERKEKDFLVVDAAMNDLIRPALYQSYHEVVPIEKNGAKSKMRKTDVVGPVCESSDCFAGDRLLPAGLKQGDLLAVLSAGAYGFSMASNYNTRPKPPEVLVEDGQYSVIRKRESFEDLLKGERN